MASKRERNNTSANIGKTAHKVLCIGEVLWDMLPTGAKVGGAPLNVALHLRKFGIDSIFAGRVGDDDLGKELMEFINANGLDTRLIQTDTQNPTSTVEVFLGENNHVSYEIVDNVAWDFFEADSEIKEVAGKSDVIIYGTLSSRHSFTRNNIFSLLDGKSLKLIDVNLRPPFHTKEVVELLISKADIAKLNDDELRVIGEWYGMKLSQKELAKWFISKYKCQLVCITRGENGAMIYDGDQYYEHPGYKVKVVDTVGSGDAFLAGFLSKYLSGEPTQQALDFACATGAFVATREGATPDYRIEDINEIICRKTTTRSV
ncbi:MAG TPA: carbohydrate kinase [Bacteroidales bacterium]|nr:carbohydrate kinase [Bacteroidales bacterium]